MASKDTTTKIALVTGANKGIGYEIVKGLARQGVTVLLGARNPVFGEEAVEKLKTEDASWKVRAVTLDVTNAETIEQVAGLVKSEYGGKLDILVNNAKLDILVNNAGIVDGSDGLPGVASLDSVERTFQTNFFGVIRLTQAVLPFIKAAPAGRIVNVSSLLGSLHLNTDHSSPYAGVKYIGYNTSKTALNMLTIQLAYELRETKVKVNSSDPGYCATDLNNHQGYKTPEQGAADSIRLALLPDDGPTGGFTNDDGVAAW